ncbi:AAA family ATPase [Lyngbya sp. CCY1209]|uniref:trifunctional serine/threonine-protein kinase/ATP-binding protein/sensor histidine kinase n=1 Tax=Lyngbya sp. CCY1209 TaxID=2886103 RepID=UPI002D1FCE0B|nr:AAA family ATPase [Lyngbya sp. CCY1209]MEB3884942.1 trifunctional serine/threonine-protein kinase/ATP-binding protein/sensor histidine kinase [Lyngbya sp. CCY1209]
MSLISSTSQLPEIPGYTLVEPLYLGSRTAVYRGVQTAQQCPVVIKLLRRENPSFGELVQFRNQYAIAKNLPVPGIVHPLSLEPVGNSYALVMEDGGGISLETYSHEQPLDLETVLIIALQIADILHDLHQHRVIHKDIKPANLLIHPETHQVKLIDFSIASLLPKETPEIQNPNILEGTLAYLAPEQTGRMNRGIDYRADYYALGVTLYQLLTGGLPFATNDPLELVHSHIAKVATPVHEVNPNIPEIVGAMVAKLMAKNAEDRYQSAVGIKQDFQHCLNQWQKTGTIRPFELGQRDLSDRFIIPEKLYGRETEVQTLLDAFYRVSEGGLEVMLVAGFSGIGKTAVINEVHKPIVKKRGYFIKGKFDQFNRDIPLSAFVQAFRDLMEQLLCESDQQLADWKAKIMEAVGENGQVLIEVIPELEPIIGSQPPALQLSGTASQNRFNRLFQKFIEVFTQAEHPLVMFLDDLQWADSASLQLLKLLMNGRGYLLLLGAYRDNEVSPGHPFIRVIEELKKARVVVHTITLAPLQLEEVNPLVADTLTCEPELAQSLTQMVVRKTQGNPFFITQFLKTLHREGYITFNAEYGCWEYNITEITAVALSDDVVEFMAQQLQRLSPETQDILKLAACIGNEFDLTTLGIISERSPSQVAIALWRALQEGLILPTTPVYKFFQDPDSLEEEVEAVVNPSYRFLHDRVQQAADLLIPDEQKPATHWQIGQLLLERSSGEKRDEKLFEIVNQLNSGAALIDSPEQRHQLAQLNLEAGRKAVTAAAHKTASSYFQAGRNQLPPQPWEQCYELTLVLFSEAVEVAYLNGDFTQMEQLAIEVLENARTLLDKIQTYEVKIQAYVAQNRLSEALELAQCLLRQLDINLPQNPTPEDIETARQEIQATIGDRTVGELLDLPPIQHPEKLAAIRILVVLVSITFVGYPSLLPWVICEQVNLSLNYGNSSWSAFSYANYGILLSSFGDFKISNDFGELGINLLEKFQAKSLKSKIFNTVYAMLTHWHKPLQDCLRPLMESYQSGLETGDIEYAAYSLLHHNEYNYFCGQNLNQLAENLDNYSHALIQINQLNTLTYHEIYRQIVLNLLGLSENPTELVGDAYDERRSLPRHEQIDDRYALYQVYLNKLILSYLFGEIEKAVQLANLAQQYIDGVSGLYFIPVFYFYDSLVRLAAYGITPQDEQPELLQKVQNNQQKMRRWAEAAPMNFRHKFQLVEAERFRVLGEIIAAIESYEQAIVGASRSQYRQEAALAYELVGQFYLAWDKPKIAQVYLTDAYHAYLSWGARAKVADLESRYPRLLAGIFLPQRPAFSATETLLGTPALTVTQTAPKQSSSASSSTSLSITLDLATVLKASQTLSSEIELDKLLAILLQTVLENAGADKSVLLMSQQNQWFVEAVATLDQPVQVQSIPLSSYPELPQGLIYRVKRSLDAMVIGDATADPLLATDTYILQKKPKSLLCVPILQQGKLIALLYLENHLTIDAFTRDRVETLKILASQAAISIEKARLYEQVAEYSHHLEAEVERKTQALRQKALDLEQTLKNLQQTQAQLIQSEKMSALGQLVGGIAHEINNPINFIHGNLEYASRYVIDLLQLIDLYEQEYPQENPVIQGAIEEIELEFIREDYLNLFQSMKNGSERIKKIVLSLRNFSRLDESELKSVDIHDGLESTLVILQNRLAGKDNLMAIDVIKNYGKIPHIFCYAGQLNQVFLSIFSNAIDALKDRRQEPEKAVISIKTERSNQEQIKIVIADNGSGISEELKNRIFEPFFTTKPVGSGTGLGLSVSYAILTRHGGSLTCQSQLGVGTEMIIQLPLSRGDRE